MKLLTMSLTSSPRSKSISHRSLLLRFEKRSFIPLDKTFRLPVQLQMITSYCDSFDWPFWIKLRKIVKWSLRAIDEDKICRNTMGWVYPIESGSIRTAGYWLKENNLRPSRVPKIVLQKLSKLRKEQRFDMLIVADMSDIELTISKRRPCELKTKARYLIDLR